MYTLVAVLLGIFALLAVSPVHSMDEYIIGDRIYKKTVILQGTTVNSRIIRDDNSALIFVSNYKLFILKPESLVPMEVKIPEMPSVREVKDHQGVIWVGTNLGIYKYNSIKNTVTFSSGKETRMESFSIASDNILCGSNFIQGLLYVIHSDNIGIIPDVRGFIIAFAGSGVLYYTDRHPGKILYKMEKELNGKSKEIGGLPVGQIWHLEVDRRNEYLYICHDTGLYFLKPGDVLVRKVSGFHTARSMGISQGTTTIYIGMDGEVWKMAYYRPLKNDGAQQAEITSTTSSPQVNLSV